MKTLPAILALQLSILPFSRGQTATVISAMTEAEVAKTPEFQAAKAAQKGDNGAEKLSLAKVLVERFPASSLAHKMIADAYCYIDFFDEAAASLQKAIQINPKDPIAWRDLGQTRMMQNKRNEAEEAYKNAVRAARTEATPWADLARYYSDTGNTTFALQCATYASKLLTSTIYNDHNGEVPESWTWANVGVAYLGGNRPADAVTHLKRAVALDPNNDHIWTGLAHAYARQGDRAKAASAAKQASKLAPESEDSKSVMQSPAASPTEEPSQPPQQPQQQIGPEQIKAYIELFKSLQGLTDGSDDSNSNPAAGLGGAISRNDRLRMLYVLRDAKVISSIRNGERMSDDQIVSLYQKALEQQRLKQIQSEMDRLRQQQSR